MEVGHDAIARASPLQGFTTTKFTAAVAEARPWRPEHGALTSPTKLSHRKHLSDVHAITEGRAEMLQAYLVSQLSNGSLSSDQQATFSASIIPNLSGAESAARSPHKSPKRRSPGRKKGNSVNTSAEASALIQAREAKGDASLLFGASGRRSFSPNHRRCACCGRGQTCLDPCFPFFCASLTLGFAARLRQAAGCGGAGGPVNLRCERHSFGRGLGRRGCAERVRPRVAQ